MVRRPVRARVPLVSPPWALVQFVQPLGRLPDQGGRHGARNRPSETAGGRGAWPRCLWRWRRRHSYESPTGPPPVVANMNGTWRTPFTLSGTPSSGLEDGCFSYPGKSWPPSPTGELQITQAGNQVSGSAFVEGEELFRFQGTATLLSRGIHSSSLDAFLVPVSSHPSVHRTQRTPHATAPRMVEWGLDLFPFGPFQRELWHRFPTPQQPGRGRRELQESRAGVAGSRAGRDRSGCKLLGWMVRPAGVEPATYSSGGCRSIQLSYGRGMLRRTKWGERRDSNPQRLEPQSRALPLSYAHHGAFKAANIATRRLSSRHGRSGLPGGIRTPDPRLRRPLLCPSELQAVRFLEARESVAVPGE